MFAGQTRRSFLFSSRFLFLLKFTGRNRALLFLIKSLVIVSLTFLFGKNWFYWSLKELTIDYYSFQMIKNCSKYWIGDWKSYWLIAIVLTCEKKKIEFFSIYCLKFLALNLFKKLFSTFLINFSCQAHSKINFEFWCMYTKL